MPLDPDGPVMRPAKAALTRCAEVFTGEYDFLRRSKGDHYANVFADEFELWMRAQRIANPPTPPTKETTP